MLANVWTLQCVLNPLYSCQSMQKLACVMFITAISVKTGAHFSSSITTCKSTYRKAVRTKGSTQKQLKALQPFWIAELNQKGSFLSWVKSLMWFSGQDNKSKEESRKMALEHLLNRTIKMQTEEKAICFVSLFFSTRCKVKRKTNLQKTYTCMGVWCEVRNLLWKVWKVFPYCCWTTRSHSSTIFM